MKAFRSILLIAGVQLFFTASGTVLADQIIDNEFDDNENNFEYYWYYFDDNAGVGYNDRPQSAPETTPSEILVPFTERPREFRGDKSDAFKIKEYEFKTEAAGSNSFATMPFTFGDEFEVDAGWSMQPFVGIGTMLAPDGKSIDLAGATKIKFKLKSRVKSLSVRFKIQTFEIDSISAGSAEELDAENNNPFGYYGKNVTVATGGFQEFEINLDEDGGDLSPPAWAKYALPFNLKRVTKLAWEVNKDDNSTITGDTLDIDAIEVIAYTYNSPRLWKKTVPMTPLPEEAVLFSNFDNNPPAKNTFDKYWYAYNDASVGGNSAILSGAALNDQTNLLDLNWKAQSGSTGSDTGLEIHYQIGDPVMQGQIKVRGFVGVGCNTYDSTTEKYWDVKDAGIKNIYFHYITDGDIPYLTLEISDINDVADKSNPERKDGRGSGVVWYKNFPHTSGKWVAVELPLDSLYVNSHWKDAKDTPLDLTKIAKLQWKVQGAKGKSGAVGIDNVYFTKTALPVVRRSRINENKLFQKTYSNGQLRIIVSKSIKKGTVRLFNSNGTMIATKALNSTNVFSDVNFSSGCYIIQIDAENVNRQTVKMQAPLFIVK